MSIKLQLKADGHPIDQSNYIVVIEKTPRFDSSVGSFKNNNDDSPIIRYNVGLDEKPVFNRSSSHSSDNQDDLIRIRPPESNIRRATRPQTTIGFSINDRGRPPTVDSSVHQHLSVDEVPSHQRKISPKTRRAPPIPTTSLTKIRSGSLSSPVDPSKPKERVVFLVGGTGSGKTTLINSITNYLYSVDVSDPFRFQVVSSDDENRNSKLQSSSKTKTVIAYSFHRTHLNYVLTLVDTPGFGDTQGRKVDKQTIGYIREYFERELADAIDRLYAICLVIKSNETRLTTQFVSELNQVASLFGADIQSNMFAMITFHDWSGDAPVLRAFHDHETIKFQSHFYINNTGIFAKAGADNRFTHAQALFWKNSIASIDQFMQCLESLAPITLRKSHDVLMARAQIDTQIAELRQNINDELNLLQKAAIYLANISRNREIAEQTDAIDQWQSTQVQTQRSANAPNRLTKIIRSINRSHVNCTECDRTCHKDCLMPFTLGIRFCEVMVDGKCQVCGHYAIMHKNESKYRKFKNKNDRKMPDENDIQPTIREYMQLQKLICDRYRQLQLIYHQLEIFLMKWIRSTAIKRSNRTDTIVHFLNQMISDAMHKSQLSTDNVDMQSLNLAFINEQLRYANLIVENIADVDYNPMNEYINNRYEGLMRFRNEFIEWITKVENEEDNRRNEQNDDNTAERF